MTTRTPWVVVRLATLLLPRGETRRRYRREVDSELHDLPPGDRLGHALRFLLRSPALAVATTTTPIHCRLHLWHHYVTRSTDDGACFRVCSDCDREDPYLRQVNDSMGWAGATYPFGT